MKIILSILAAGALTACASAPHPDPVGQAVSQPVRDLNLARNEAPAVLQHAALAPYAMPSKPGCAPLSAELNDLDAALGPDVDKPANPDSAMDRALAGAVPGLPFRGVVREITGAGRRDRELQRTVLAGVARRAFLKGLARGWACVLIDAPQGPPTDAQP